MTDEERIDRFNHHVSLLLDEVLGPLPAQGDLRVEAQTHQTLGMRQTFSKHGMKVPGEIAESAEGAQSRGYDG